MEYLGSLRLAPPFEKFYQLWADAQVMAAQPNIGGALCESSVTNSIPCTTPQSLADARCWSTVQ